MASREIISKPEDGPILQIGKAEAALTAISSEQARTERLATLGMLAAGIAHETRNLLTPVLAYAQMALTRRDDLDLVAKALEKTITGVETATRIADAILGFAGDDDAVDAEVAHVVQASLDCLARDPNKYRINLRIEVQPATLVHMNPLNLQQVLMNLILNAHAAMRTAPAGSRMSSENALTIAAITRADGTVGIRVTDTGPGIPKEVAGRIFEPFVTTKRSANAATGAGSASSNSDSTASSPSISREQGGTGLGLAICRRLIEQAGGTITASSTPGRGTTFLIVLPSPKTSRAKAG